MLTEHFINREFIPLSPSDSVSKALARMDAWQSLTLPVVEPATGKLTGQVTLAQLTDVADESDPVSSLQLGNAVTLFPHQHVFEATRTLLMHEVRFVAVVDSEQTYLGILEKEKMLEVLTGLLNVTVHGSVLTVELESRDYTLSELVQLIEFEQARILGIAVQAPEEPAQGWLVSFKLNVRDTSGISRSLRRHGYTVRSEANSELLQFDISDRADELMRYLDV